LNNHHAVVVGGEIVAFAWLDVAARRSIGAASMERAVMESDPLSAAGVAAGSANFASLERSPLPPLRNVAEPRPTFSYQSSSIFHLAAMFHVNGKRRNPEVADRIDPRPCAPRSR
jgi:hypothetical protein